MSFLNYHRVSLTINGGSNGVTNQQLWSLVIFIIFNEHIRILWRQFWRFNRNNTMIWTGCHRNRLVNVFIVALARNCVPKCHHVVAQFRCVRIQIANGFTEIAPHVVGTDVCEVDERIDCQSDSKRSALPSQWGHFMARDFQRAKVLPGENGENGVCEDLPSYRDLPHRMGNKTSQRLSLYHCPTASFHKLRGRFHHDSTGSQLFEVWYQ